MSPARRVSTRKPHIFGCYFVVTVIVTCIQLAQMGNMRRIRERAEHVGSLGQQYLPFAERLKMLADQFQSRAIVDFIKDHLDGRGM